MYIFCSMIAHSRSEILTKTHTHTHTHTPNTVTLAGTSLTVCSIRKVCLHKHRCKGNRLRSCYILLDRKSLSLHLLQGLKVCFDIAIYYILLGTMCCSKVCRRIMNAVRLLGISALFCSCFFHCNNMAGCITIALT